LLIGSYDCVDRIVLNGYFRMGLNPGGFRVWWRALTGSDETLEKHLLDADGRPLQPARSWLRFANEDGAEVYSHAVRRTLD
jgi:hypothetical protein